MMDAVGSLKVETFMSDFERDREKDDHREERTIGE